VRIVAARLPARDPGALTDWYVETLGVGHLSFVPGQATPHHFAFHVADLEPWKKRFDVSEEHDFSSWGGARAVYFRDPEENVVELIARPQARRELAIAEVGLPVDDVTSTVEALGEQLGLEPYDDWDESFAPLGDADGLLIVVRVGRNWFPVGVPAGRSRIEVTLAGTGTGEVNVPGVGHRIVGAV
jgi:hypothetical protein